MKSLTIFEIENKLNNHFDPNKSRDHNVLMFTTELLALVLNDDIVDFDFDTTMKTKDRSDITIHITMNNIKTPLLTGTVIQNTTTGSTQHIVNERYLRNGSSIFKLVYSFSDNSIIQDDSDQYPQDPNEAYDRAMRGIG